MDARPIVHQFFEKLRQGQAVERELDEHFRDKYSIRKASMDEQRIGIDRVFVDRETMEAFRVEYKADYRAVETGNVFVETVSVDSRGVRGWAYTSEADWLVYALPQLRRYLLVRVVELREALPNWIQRYPQGKARNRTYTTHGVLVPIVEFERLAALSEVEAEVAQRWEGLMQLKP